MSTGLSPLTGPGGPVVVVGILYARNNRRFLPEPSARVMGFRWRMGRVYSYDLYAVLRHHAAYAYTRDVPTEILYVLMRKYFDAGIIFYYYIVAVRFNRKRKPIRPRLFDVYDATPRRPPLSSISHAHAHACTKVYIGLRDMKIILCTCVG